MIPISHSTGPVFWPRSISCIKSSIRWTL